MAVERIHIMNVQRRAVMPNPTKDTRTSTLRDEAAATFYLPFAQFPNTEGRSLLPSVLPPEVVKETLILQAFPEIVNES